MSYRAVLTQQVKDQHAELCKDFLGGFLSELTGLRSHRRVSFDGKIHRSPQVFMPSMLCTFLYFVTILKRPGSSATILTPGAEYFTDLS